MILLRPDSLLADAMRLAIMALINSSGTIPLPKLLKMLYQSNT